MLRLVLVIVAIGLVIGAMMPADIAGPGATQPAPADGPTLIAPAGKEQPATQAAAAMVDGPWTTLTRQDNGHFFARAQVNGQSVDFMVDTGASGVALTEADARRIGIPLDPASYVVVGSGASGAVYGQHVTLDSVSLDGKRVDHVSGAVLQGSEISLLGQSFLSRMGRIEISGDRMIIR